MFALMFCPADDEWKVNSRGCVPNVFSHGLCPIFFMSSFHSTAHPIWITLLKRQLRLLFDFFIISRPNERRQAESQPSFYSLINNALYLGIFFFVFGRVFTLAMINCLHTNFCIWTYVYFFLFWVFFICLPIASAKTGTKKRDEEPCIFQHKSHWRLTLQANINLSKRRSEKSTSPVLILCRFHATIPFKCCTRLINWWWFFGYLAIRGSASHAIPDPNLVWVLNYGVCGDGARSSWGWLIRNAISNAALLYCIDWKKCIKCRDPPPSTYNTITIKVVIFLNNLNAML